MLKKKIRSAARRISNRLIDEDIRGQVFCFLSTISLFFVSLGGLVLDFITGQYTLGYLSIGYSVAFLALSIVEFVCYTKIKRINNLVLQIAFLVLSLAIATTCFVFGPKTGWYLIWIITLPLLYMLTFGRVKGTFVCLFLLAETIFIFYVPGIKSLMLGDPAPEGYNFSLFAVFFITDFILCYIVGLAVTSVNAVIVKRLSVLKDTYYEDANTDITTGLRNQAYFLSYVNKIPFMMNYGDSIGLMFIDIDDFKQFNDKYGHTIGNEILIKVANKLNEVPHSLITRWGGDEFAIVETNLTRDELIAKANYLLKSVEGLGKGITISIGLAYYVIDENFNFDVLFNEADMQAIRAKGKGKNCIIIKE